LSAEKSTTAWIRVEGMLTMILGFYYGMMALQDVRAFFRATVYGRLAVPVFFTGFVVSGLAPPILILMGVVDVLGAIWKAWALTTDGRSRAKD